MITENSLSISIAYDKDGIEALGEAVVSVMDTLPPDDKSLMGLSPDAAYPSGSPIICRIVAYSADVPAGFLDLERRGSSSASVVVAVSPAYRGHGVSSDLVASAIEWQEGDGFIHAIVSRIEWFAKRKNKTSLYLAQKYGFVPYDGFYDEEEWWGGYRDIPNDVRGRLVLQMARGRLSWSELVRQELEKQTAETENVA